MSRPIFFMRRSDRLIARLKLLLYTWRFSEAVGGQAIMIWPNLPEYWHKYDGANYSPNLIFDLAEFYARGEASNLLFLEGQSFFPPDRAVKSVLDTEFEKFRPNRFVKSDFIGSDQVYLEKNAAVCFFEDEPRTQDFIQSSLQGLFERLPHTAAVKRGIEHVKSVIKSDDYIALHVRRGDVDDMLRQELPQMADGSLAEDRLRLLLGHYVARTALYEYYYPEIEDAIYNGQRLMYFSDSPETIKHFQAKFGERHFLDVNVNNPRFPLQKAFIQFNLLIGASKIIGTSSNYAAFATMLGGGEHINASERGEIEGLEVNLYESYLSKAKLNAASRKTLRVTLEAQLSRFLSLRRKRALVAG